MDWTDTLKDAHGVDNAAFHEWRIKNWPKDAQWDAFQFGLLSGASLGRSEGTGSSMLRTAYPVTYRAGQYLPALMALRYGGAGIPLATALGGGALLNEPAVQRYYNDNIAPRPYPTDAPTASDKLVNALAAPSKPQPQQGLDAFINALIDRYSMPESEQR